MPAVFRYLARVVRFATEKPAAVDRFERDWPDAGALMGYGRDPAAYARRAAYYVDRILQGANPADLPVEQPMIFEFVVNLKTARELGLTFPNEILLQVTEAVQ